MKKVIMILIILLNFFIFSFSDNLDNWEYWHGSGFFRFTFSFSEDPVYKIVKLEDKRLFVLDINTPYKKETQFVNIDRGNVESVRIGAFTPEIMRIVVKLKYVNEVKVYKANQKVGDFYNLFIDIDDFYAPNEKKEAEKFIVTIDPGHGGFDPGALNRHFNVAEKNFCLDVAHKVKWIFEQSGINEIDIKLTREGDIFLPLKKRTQISNSNNSDLFISIHADSSYRSSARGASFYYYSDVSSSAEANWVAFKENNEVISHEKVEQEEISLILNDILSHTNQKSSSNFAGIMKNNFEKNDINIHGGGVFSANFSVLQFAQSPALLLEIGFISNNEECKLLMSNIYRYNLAKSI
ncbi:MAG: N-acetylmuramoyl-L-alanine amidase, partial [Candidatus Muiribacteriota bacterium]